MITKKKVTKKKVVKKQRVVRTRNGGTWTESEFWSKISNTLRNMSRWWLPIRQAKLNARRKCQTKGRQIWEYQCEKCKLWKKDNLTIVHHKVEVGSLKKYDDLPGVVARLFSENLDDYAVLCKPCHQLVHSKKINN